MGIQLEILLLFYMLNHFERPPSNIAYNRGIPVKFPERSESATWSRSVSDEEVG